MWCRLALLVPLCSLLVAASGDADAARVPPRLRARLDRELTAWIQAKRGPALVPVTVELTDNATAAQAATLRRISTRATLEVDFSAQSLVVTRAQALAVARLPWVERVSWNFLAGLHGADRLDSSLTMWLQTGELLDECAAGGARPTSTAIMVEVGGDFSSRRVTRRGLVELLASRSVTRVSAEACMRPFDRVTLGPPGGELTPQAIPGLARHHRAHMTAGHLE